MTSPSTLSLNWLVQQELRYMLIGYSLTPTSAKHCCVNMCTQLDSNTAIGSFTATLLLAHMPQMLDVSTSISSA